MGTQARTGQSPPGWSISTTATLRPSSCNRFAAVIPAEPQPTTPLAPPSKFTARLKLAWKTLYRIDKMCANGPRTLGARHPERFGLPSADRFKNDMGRFFSHQPPRVQAQMGQFLIDLKKQRAKVFL